MGTFATDMSRILTNKPHVWAIAFAVASIPMTYGGWVLFGLTYTDRLEDSPLIDAIMYVCLWPCLLLDEVGVSVTNHSLGFIPNLIGWSFAGLAFGLAIRERRANNAMHTDQKSAPLRSADSAG